MDGCSAGPVKSFRELIPWADFVLIVAAPEEFLAKMNTRGAAVGQRMVSIDRQE